MFSTFRNTAVGAAALALAIGFAAPAQAGYIVTVEQVGSNVVATGSGKIDLTGLSIVSGVAFIPQMIPFLGLIATGATTLLTDDYDASAASAVTGPASFGSGPQHSASSGSGDIVAMWAGEIIAVPQNYASDSPLSDTASYNGQTLSGLGATPGTYEWKWGTGVDQNFTVQIGPAAAAPEPASLTVLTLGLVGLGMVLRTRRV